jgi:2-haloacid dehalogenase
MTDPETIKALFFDVFGTLVDWRSGIARNVRRLLEPHGIAIDADAFADAWRGEYQHRHTLDRILPRFGLDALDEDTRVALNLAWHHLPAWPEVPAALRRLRARFRLAPVSNGNISLMADLARDNSFHWDAILGAEIARDYKPKPAVYLAAAEAFDLAPAQCLMVAAHSSDLAAAAALGLATAHVARPREHGPHGGETKPELAVDFAAADLAALATKLGC